MTNDFNSQSTKGPVPAPASALKVRCPHCHNRLELVEEATAADIECPTCGSHFSLTAFQSTASHQRDRPRKIAHFELIEQVGYGSFGSVWNARDTKLYRTVAVKIPRKEQLDADETEQFLREARAGAQIQHPNIVGVHEVGRENDSVYIVTDFVKGATLAEWLSDQRLTAREAAELCVTIADALHAAHQSGVVHRDLKPGNIMIDLDGVPYITDFGLAKRDAGEITMTVEGRVLGTPAYMSPEQADGKAHQADRRSDVYSLGVILYQLLTAELPFRGDARMVIVQVLRDEPPSPRKLNGRIPRDLETICLKCMEKDPNRRYQTAANLKDDLSRYLGGQPVLARPVGIIGRVWRWYRGNPEASVRVAGGYATALSIVLLIWGLQGLFLYGFGIDPAEDARRGMIEISMVIVCLYLPLLCGGLRVLKGDERFLWPNCVLLCIGVFLTMLGLFRLVVFAGAIGQSSVRVPLLVLLADVFFLGALVHVVALASRHRKSES